jgi:thioredoxin-related protein
MKNSLILLGISFCLVLCGCNATKKGSSTPKTTTVKFQEGPPFYNLLEQSKTKKKIIFIDFYTAGCLPCRVMDETVFTEDVVYKYYNKNFINVKMDGVSFDYYEVAKQYDVKEYPTLVYVDEMGNLLHSVSGSVSAAKLLEIGKEVIAKSVL